MENLIKVFDDIIKTLGKWGLHVAPEKVQTCSPITFLGHQILDTCVRPQKIQLAMEKLKTLNDFQKLLGDINWIRPNLGITTGQLKPLFDILQGDSDPTSPRNLTPESRKTLKLVEQA